MRAEHHLDTIGESGRRLADSGQDVAARASVYVQARMGEVSERAQELAQDASHRVEQMTGRSIEAWTRDARKYVDAHPLQAVAIAIGVGYVLGKLVARNGP